MKIFNDVRSRSPLGEVGQKPVDTPLLAAGSRAFERIVFIYDHVHLSFAGNFKVATAMSEAVILQVGPSAAFPVSMEQVSSTLAYSEWDELQIFRKLTEQLLSKPPYTNQWNHRQKQLSRQREVRKMASRFSPEAREKSLRLYQTVLDKRPDDGDLKRRMSALLVDRGDFEKARELLLSAASESPGDIETLYDLSLVSVSLEKYDEAEQSLLRILERNPYSIEVRNAYLLLLFNSKRFVEAARYNEKLFQDHPEDPDFRHLFALILNAQGKRSEAWEQFQKALQIDPTHSKTRSLMIEILQGDNKLAQALQVARAWSLADPESSEAQLEEAKLLSQEKDYKRAMEHYRKVFELDPDFVAARSSYVQLLVGQGRIQEAIQSLGEDLNKDPDIREGHSMLGLLLDVAGRKSEAVRVFSAGLERDPNNLKILRELAWIKATSKDAQWRNGAEAVQLAKHAVEWAPNDPDFLQVLAAAYAENRQFDNAILSARQALRLADAANNHGLSALIRKCIPAYENRQPIRIN